MKSETTNESAQPMPPARRAGGLIDLHARCPEVAETWRQRNPTPVSTVSSGESTQPPCEPSLPPQPPLALVERTPEEADATLGARIPAWYWAAMGGLTLLLSLYPMLRLMW